MLKSLKTDMSETLENAELYCAENGITLTLVYHLSDDLLEVIAKRSQELPSLYSVNVDLLKTRLENGVFLLKKEDEVIGHIFAHKHLVNKIEVFERSSLWVSRDYRNANLGLLLMSKMTRLYDDKFLISIAQTSKVHHYNELLGMSHITLAQMSNVLVETLEELGKLRDELKYRYYVNAYFEKGMRIFKLMG